MSSTAKSRVDRPCLGAFDGVGIDDFASVITRDTSRPKPHPEGVYQAANQMGVYTSEILRVGDFRFDILAGKAAGARTVLVTKWFGFTSAADRPPTG